MVFGQPLDTVLFLLRQPNNVTEFEKQNGIHCIGVELLEKYSDIHFYSVLKSDNTKTLTIVFRTGVNSDSWSCGE